MAENFPSIAPFAVYKGDMMKHVVAWIFAVAVVFVTSLFAKGFWPFVAGAAALALVYHLASFLKYTKSTPKERLAFHEGDHFTSWSLREIESMRYELAQGGLLKMSNDHRFYCSVQPEKWQELTDSEKLTFCRLCHQACVKIHEEDIMGHFSVEAHTPDFDTSTDTELLTVYVPNKGLLTPDEFYDMPPFGE